MAEKTETVLTKETRIPLGWALTLGFAIAGAAFKVVLSQVVIEQQIGNNSKALEEIKNTLDGGDVIQRNELRAWIQRLHDLNAELTVPPLER